MMPNQLVTPIEGTLDATVVLPGSKSLTNRALIVAALARGTTTLTGVGLSDDTEAMIGALGALGIATEVDGTTVTVHGTGGELAVPTSDLDANQSGTSARFLVPMLAIAGSGTLTGHEQMRARPMADLTVALRDLGATVESDTLPISVSSGVTGREVSIGAEVSSQFISALLLCAPAFPKGLDLTLVGTPVSQPYIDMTIAVMVAFGATVDATPGRIVVEPTGYDAITYAIEPDASTATYPLAAAAIVGGRITVSGLGSTSLQGDAEFATRVLEPMGASVYVDADSIEVRGSGLLDPLTVDLGDMSDTAPTFAALASKASGTSAVHGIGFIRTTKESDRVQASVDELARLGIESSIDDDGFTVVGGGHAPAAVETYEDHRMAMALALIGLTHDSVEVTDPGCVAKTFPGFWDMLDELRSTARTAPLVLAIDGPAGSGKSTVAKLISQRLRLPHLDTGAMYRAVTYAVLQAGVHLDDHAAVTAAAEAATIVVGPSTVVIDGVDVTTQIREPDVTAAVSAVAAIAGVRVVLAESQRQWARARGAAVLEGRDIGTAVFPDATLKIYLDASVDERARRRASETGDADIDAMKAAIAERDQLDMSRETDPLVVADGAEVIDTTGLTVDEVTNVIARAWGRQ